MEIYLTVVAFVFGTLFGSFYNVVGYRLPNNLSIVKPGSFCPKCNHSLKWYELIPIFSFLIQKGKCRSCKCSISKFYPFIELLTGILFALSYLLFGPTVEFFLGIIISSFFVIVIVSDVNYLIIPDEATIFFSILVIFIKLIFYGWQSALSALLCGIFLFCMMYVLMILGNSIFKKESLGGGDIKLMFFVGTLLSPLNGLFSIFLSSVLALPTSLYTLLKKNSKIIPFGPFLLLSLLLIYFLGIDIMSFLQTL